MLSRLRQAMERRALHAVIIPSSDPHNSEDVADAFKLRAKVSQFHGSAGTCVVTATKALLWTDGRYWLEAEKSLSAEWQLMRDGAVDTPTYDVWLENEFGSVGSSGAGKVGLDPFLVTVSAWEKLQKKVNLVPAVELVGPAVEAAAAGKEDVDATVEKIIVRPEVFCGESAADKVKRTAHDAATKKCDLLFLSALDDIAWITNLRGCDVPYNPVFYAYAMVDARSATITVFTDPQKLPNATKTPSADASATGDGAVSSCISFQPYAHLEQWIKAQPPTLSVGVDENQTSQGALELLSGHFATVRRLPGIVQGFKAIKNTVEVQGFKDCHVRDGVALTRFLAWLDDKVRAGEVVDEVGAADYLESLRRAVPRFVQLSFGTISGSGPNAAIIHYAPAKATSSAIHATELYLVDSGGQYLDGTTDVTRTVCFATSPRPFEREAYTLVLKGHIAINTAVWPKGTTGHRIDAFARTALWQRGLDYAHGTGHGVGSFLNVHEGPHGIGMRPTVTGAPLDIGMICSNEPGYYKNGAFGIRIENLEVIVPAATAYGGGGAAGGFQTFETLTMAPLCRDLIDVALLTPAEVAWVDGYHAKVQQALLPLLEAAGDTLAVAYLLRHTAPLQKDI